MIHWQWVGGFLRKRSWIFGTGLLLLLISGGLFFPVRSQYQDWRRDQLIKQVDTAFHEGRLHRGTQMLFQIVRDDPGNVQAWDRLGSLALKYGQENEFNFRRNAFRLKPLDPGRRQALVLAAIRWGREAEARQDLEAHPPDKWTGVEHSLRGILYLEEGNPEQALNHFEKAVSLDPTHPDYPLNLISVLIAMNPRDERLDFWLNGEERSSRVRWLRIKRQVRLADQERLQAEVLDWMQEPPEEPQWWPRVAGLLRTHRSELSTPWEKLWDRQAGEQPALLGTRIRFLLEFENFPKLLKLGERIGWSRVEQASHWWAFTTAAAAVGDRPLLDQLLGMGSDHRWCEESELKWIRAMSEGGGEGPSLRMATRLLLGNREMQTGTRLRLLELARAARWEVGIEEILWSLLELSLIRDAAASELMDFYKQKRSGAGLLRVLKKLRTFGDLPHAFHHNFLLISLLRGPVAPEIDRMAGELYQAHPRALAAVSLESVRLVRSGQAEKASQLWNQWTKQHSHVSLHSDAQLYRAAAYAAAGDLEQAEKILQNLQPDEFLLEEWEYLQDSLHTVAFN